MNHPIKILVVAPNFPYKKDTVYPFVKNLCDEFSKKGLEVSILAPQSITSAILHFGKLRPKKWSYEVGNSKIVVYQPYSITPLHRMLKLYNLLIQQCILYFLRKEKIKADICYCHFWCSAYWVLPYMKRNNIPVFVASGESQISEILSNRKQYPDFKDYVKGVICVSSKNRDESVSLGYTTVEKCSIFPNAINPVLFYERDKKSCRSHLGLPQDVFIVVFVGWFIDRKGPLRVAEAISKVGGVYSLFIGKGEQEPHCEGILFKGSLPHDEIPLYLNAADCFVLPTLHEGCCNAVVEAMACGLPVISSNLPFNWDVLDETNSILVDPNNIDEIVKAISLLRDDNIMRCELAKGALTKAKSLTIEKRSEGILRFIKDKFNN